MRAAPCSRSSQVEVLDFALTAIGTAPIKVHHCLENMDRLERVAQALGEARSHERTVTKVGLRSGGAQ